MRQGVLLVAMGGAAHRRNRACYRSDVGLGPTRQGLGEQHRAKWWWLLAAAAASGASMHSFAQIQRTLHRNPPGCTSSNGGRRPPSAPTRTTLPGGPVLSATFLLRQQHPGRLDGGGVMAAGHVGRCCRRWAWRCSGWVAHSSWAPRTTRSHCCSPWAASSHCCYWPRRWRAAGAHRGIGRVCRAGPTRFAVGRPMPAYRSNADAHAAGSRSAWAGATVRRGVRLVVVQLDRRRSLPRFRRVRRRRGAVPRSVGWRSPRPAARAVGTAAMPGGLMTR